MVAGHLRVANVIPAHHEYVISLLPKQLLRCYGQNMVDLLAQNVREGLIEKDRQGELVARLLLTLAHDQALENMAHKANQGQLERKKNCIPRPPSSPSFVHSFHNDMLTTYCVIVRIIALVARLLRRHLTMHMLYSLILARLLTTGVCHMHSCSWCCSVTWQSLVERGWSMWNSVHSYPLLLRDALVQDNYEFDSCLHQRQSGRHGHQLHIRRCQ